MLLEQTVSKHYANKDLLEKIYIGLGQLGIDKDQFIYSQMPEPLGTIMRLKKNNEPKGNELLKRYFARTSNMFGDDEVPADLFIQGDTAGLKKYMIAKQIEQMKSESQKPRNNFPVIPVWGPCVDLWSPWKVQIRD